MNLFSYFFFLEIGGYLNKQRKRTELSASYLACIFFVPSSYQLRYFVPRIGAKEVRTGYKEEELLTKR